jgi:7-cyano-7-deazaguanine reductase
MSDQVFGARQLAASPLGQRTPYPERYDASLLYPIVRAPLRATLGITGQPIFFGADLWPPYELSWPNPRGTPQVAVAHILVPCESTHIIESKSLKLYLGGFSDTRFPNAEAVRGRIERDLSAALWAEGDARMPAVVRLVMPEAFDRQAVQEMDGLLLDRLDLECEERDAPAPELLTAAFDEQPVQETLTSRLLKSNCPVTGQPDWASVQICYTGSQIDQAGLLRYIVSFRRHNEFHEHCVERLFMDIWTCCRPAKLVVYARYARRGGIDINPWRTSHPRALPPDVRTARQ